MTVVRHRRNRRAEPAAGPPDAEPPIPPPPRTDAGRGGTIRGRLVGIIALPMLAVLLLLGYLTVIEVSGYRAVTTASESVSLALAVRDLTQELQTERGLTAGLLGGNVGFRDEIAPARQRVDQRRRAVESAVSGGGRVADRVNAALRELDGLPVVRAGTDSGSAGRAATFQFFTDRIATLNRIDFGLDEVTDPELRRHVATLDALSRIEESTAQQRAFLNGVFSAGGFAKGEFLQFAAMRAAREAALADFAEQATPAQQAANDWVLDTGAARVAAYFEQVALASADGRRLQVNPQSWWSSQTTVLDGMRQMQQHVGAEIEARATERQNDSTRRILVVAASVLLFLVGAVALLVVATRSITRPLAALSAEAHELATSRLPAAVRRLQDSGEEGDPEAPAPVRVPARSSSEIRSVAGALDQVQAVAFRLATEQALLRRSTTESLANLGRRNQNLLRRQLGFITKLEREESDPTGLANLFELDHLATRMRRNAESLLVLVGAGGPRQWVAPLPIADVIRAAISEVEEYRRVQLRRIDDAWVVGATVSAVAHMLAELIENGLTFSPPDSDVEIQGRRTSEGYLIAITDQGIGMSAEDLAQANARLRGEVDFVAAPTRYLGHQVVGQLALDLEIGVQLAPSPVTGVTARVVLPPGVLTTANATPPGEGPATASGGSPVAPAATPIALTATAAPARVTAEVGEAAPSGPIRAVDGPPAFSAERPGGVPRPAGDLPAPTGPRNAGEFPVTGAGGAASAQPVVDGPITVAGQVATADRVETRTINGLRKRLPREQRTVPPAPPATGAVPAPEQRPAALDDSPADIRNRLTALRAGMLRGQAERAMPVTGSGDEASTEPWRTA
ncbi:MULTISPECIES: nitrate- and nitrite sensing domain-containing protein [unclassified Micromonospora]|uniref:sensor histidine kinase n=1 Tax=unclassified Micromonospora TaxID=2617518 RepID=UPI00362F8615